MITRDMIHPGRKDEGSLCGAMMVKHNPDGMYSVAHNESNVSDSRAYLEAWPAAQHLCCRSAAESLRTTWLGSNSPSTTFPDSLLASYWRISRVRSGNGAGGDSRVRLRWLA